MPAKRQNNPWKGFPASLHESRGTVALDVVQCEGGAHMLKFVVVLVRKEGMSSLEFKRYFKDVHEPLAKKISGIKRYVQNFVVDDPRRTRPTWDAVIELYFDDWAAMEAAWASPEGHASSDDLTMFADLERTTWSVVEEMVVLG